MRRSAFELESGRLEEARVEKRTSPLDGRHRMVYIACMASKRLTTVRLDPEDLRALARARKDGVSSSELIRQGLRVAAARYYRKRRRPPTTRLFTSVDTKLGDETELFRDLER